MLTSVLFIIVFFCLSIPAHAYLDPGSGSILLYALVAGFVTLVYTVRGFFSYTIYTLFSGKKNNKMYDIIVHSEGQQYDHLFLPLLKELSQKGLSINYITQYDRSGDFEPLPGDIEHEVLGSDTAGFVKLNHVKGTVFVSTTPQLDVMMFKRSPHVSHYTYLFHSPGDIGTYKPFAFDKYDSVLCVGEFMKKSIRKIEQVRNLAPKQLFSTGVLYYDEAVRQKNEYQIEKSRKIVLIAPSWGDNSMFTNFGTDFFEQLDGDYQVIVRPHPQMKISQPELYQKVETVCDKQDFTLDTSTSNTETLARSDVLISDFSGVLYDYFYIFQKPVIIMDTQMNYEAFEGRLLDAPLWQMETRKEMATIIDNSNISDFGEIVQNALVSGIRAPEIKKDLYPANFGQSAPIAANQIIGLCKGISQA